MESGNYLKITGISDDTLTLMGVNDRFSGNSAAFPEVIAGSFDTVAILGVQIVGVIPEPSTLVLGVLGLISFVGCRWRRRRPVA